MEWGQSQIQNQPHFSDFLCLVRIWGEQLLLTHLQLSNSEIYNSNAKNQDITIIGIVTRTISLAMCAKKKKSFYMCIKAIDTKIFP